MSLTAAESPAAPVVPVEHSSHDEHELVIRPRKGWIGIDWEEMFRFRELLFFLVWRDVKVRYKQTALGILWAILVPLTQMVVFTWVFGGLKGFKDNLPPALSDKYPVFLYSGQLPWFFFAAALTAGGLSLLNAQNLLTKIYFPRLFVPTSVVLGALVDMVFSVGIYAVILISYHIVPSWDIVLVPFLLVLLIMLGLGVAYALSALTVSYRDFRFVVPFMAQIWMFVSPVLYPINLNPERHPFLTRHNWLMGLNPMYGIINAFRTSILGPQNVPWQWGSLALSAAISVAVFVYGLFYFRKTERRFADIA